MASDLNATLHRWPSNRRFRPTRHAENFLQASQLRGFLLCGRNDRAACSSVHWTVIHPSVFFSIDKGHVRSVSLPGEASNWISFATSPMLPTVMHDQACQPL